MPVKLLSGLSFAILLAVGGCKTQKGKFEFVNPESGQRVAYGEQVKLKLNFPTSVLDSVVYSVDGQVFVTKTDTSSVMFDTKEYGYGDRSLSAKVYAEGKEDIAYSNVIVLPPNAKNYAFEIVKEYPHDTKAYTQGLQFADGVLYETTGQPSQLEGVVTSLRKVNLTTGEVVKIEHPKEDFFGEGMTIVGNKIVFLTWDSNKGFFYDKNTFQKISEFAYENSKQGWGITYDGNKLIKSDGTNMLYFLNAETGKEEDSIAVFDENGKVDSLNELEFIDGKVYANIYGKDIIVIIDPKTGVVEGRINLVGLYSEGRLPNDNELNGIAYDAVGKRLFVTGKLWPKLYEIKLVER